jgi:hypothetical protein
MPVKNPRMKVMHHVEDDKQQQAEETAHKPLAEPTARKERSMTLTLGEASGVYYGSRDFWGKLFERFGLSKGKLTIKSIEFADSTNPDEAVVKMILGKA